MVRISLVVILLGALSATALALAPVVRGENGRSVPSGSLIPSVCQPATGAVVAGRVQPQPASSVDWAGDIVIDTAYVSDFAADWNLADGTMWLAEAPQFDSVVRIYRTQDHGLTWQYVFWFSTVPLSTVPRLGLVLGEGDSSYVYIFFLSPADNGNVGIVRLKPDLSSWDSYWVASGPDTITDFAVCRDYRSNYSLYCWAVVGATGQNAPFLWSRDYGRTWTGTSWFNVIEPCLAPSAGSRVNLACMNATRQYVTAGFNYNYGDSTSWDYAIVNPDTSRCHRPVIAAANTVPDSEATRWVSYTQDYHNTGDLDAMYSVRSHAWADTWERGHVFRNSSVYNEGVGDVQHYKAIGNTYVNLSTSRIRSATLDSSSVDWTWAHADNPYAWADPERVNDPGRTAAGPLARTKVVYSPGAPATGGGVLFTSADMSFLPKGLYFDAPWITTSVAEQRGQGRRGTPPATTVVRGVLRLEDSRQNTGYGAELIDASGRKVMKLQPGANDVSRLSPGAYFVRFEPSAVIREPSAVTKVVIQR
jgi:hypothetical protein